MRHTPIVIFLLFGMFTGLFYFTYFPNSSEIAEISGKVKAISTSSVGKIKNTINLYTPQTLKFINLKYEILNYLSDRSGEWAVVVTDLRTNKQVLINELEPYHGASTTKVLTAAVALKKVENGEYDLEKTYVLGQPLKQSLYLVVNKSNNEHWDYLNFNMGFDYMQRYGESLGMTNGMQINKNEITALDLNNLLISLYKTKFLTVENKLLLFLYMQNTHLENRITPGVPENITVIHKTGNYGNVVHDIGIVEAHNPYAIVVLGKNTNLNDGSETIAEISKMVYQKLNGL